MAKVPPPRPSVKSIGAKSPAVETTESKRGFRRKLVGTVKSNKMDKTVTVEVIRQTLDEKYKKYLTSRARYKAHDEKNEYLPGDRVEIQEHRPLSKNKRWIVTRLIARSADIEGLQLKDEVLGVQA
ncbi:MAG: 30S ribosomal protein S17 [Deltaproteobacteria bacterium]|nr:30S ribosomal protein S17 [Deltaproteobacteria bacterium]